MKTGIVTKKGLEKDAKNFAKAFKQIKQGKTITGPITVGGFPVVLVDENGQDVTPWQSNKGQK